VKPPKPSGNIRLIEPTLEWEREYAAFLREYVESGDKDYNISISGASDAAALIRQLQDHARGVGLPEGWVPASTYWLVSAEGRILGQLGLRHRLTPALEDFGGHIGYGVRPGERKKGYGVKILALTLEKARAMGLKRVLITCDPANIASARIIQTNGGWLSSESVAKNGRMTSRYWIDLCVGEVATEAGP
jgi:predicted acetyltransferase